ncbi:MAG: type II toxin-antitoxin system death-on-curing family toxin [Candidatus Diapherotrites archaeon]|nr:type II toxin-antitoxin system death-on-curing family toxin [Candidatus Diapherotrites archaeon]
MVKVRVDSLSKEALIKINQKFSKAGVRSEAELEYIVFKVGTTRGINRKVATMLMEIARRHPFVDGNKRTAYEAAITLLETNGKKLEVGETSKFNVVVWSVKPRTGIDDIVEWIANHTRR